MTTPQLRFRSSLFNSSQPKPEWPTEQAFGKDLAEWLRARLQCENFALSTPHWATNAWVLECRGGDEANVLRVRHGKTGLWEIEILRSRSWLAALMLPDRPANQNLAEAIHSALSREPAVCELVWRGKPAPEHSLILH